MANVVYASSSWPSAGPDADMAPGESHGWFLSLTFGDAVALSALPVAGGPGGFLVVENLMYESGTLPQFDFRVNFNVRNAGTTFIVGYAIGASITNQ
jgi:hypothetical protein